MTELARIEASGPQAKALSPAFPSSAAEIVAELERTGFVCIEDAVRPEWLEAARAHVKGLLAAQGEKYFSIIRPADEEGSPAEALVRDPALTTLLRGATEAVCPKGVADYEEVYNVLRIIAGANGEAGSLSFHYDASVITALVPIFIPECGRRKSGELLVFPNRRPFRRSVAVNMAEKLALQNRLASRRAARRVERDLDRHIRDLVPGNMYLFWGYRTYHANLACAPNSLRATMLLHYGNPHGNAASLRAVRGARGMVEALRRKRG